MCNLLIAEADPFVAGLLLRFAEESGAACVRASTGEELLALVRQGRPAILIVDPELPGAVRGWQAVRTLQRQGEAERPAVISCSWLDFGESVRLLGAVAAHLQKPELSYAEFVRALAAAAVVADRRPAGAANFTDSALPQ